MKFRSILRQSAASLLASNGVYVYTFLCTVLLMRMLLPEDFGAVALAVALVGLIEILTTFSFNTVLIQQREQASLVRSVFQGALAVILLKVLLGAVFFVVLQSEYGPQIWHLFGLLMASKMFASVGPLLVARLEKRGDFLRAALVTGGANMVAVTVAVVAVYAGSGTYGLVLREVLPPVLIVAAMVAFQPELLPRDLRRLHRRQLRVVAAASTRLYFQRGAELAYMRVPLLMVESLFGSAALGLFSQATYLVTLVNRVTAIVNAHIATVFFNRNRRDAHETHTGFIWLFAANVVVALPLTLLLWLFSEQIVLLLWGESWLNAVPYVQLMAAMTLLLPIFTLLKSRLLGLRRNHAITAVYATGLVFLVLGLWTVHALAEPASWAAGLTAAAYALMVVLCGVVLWSIRHAAGLHGAAQLRAVRQNETRGR